MSGKDARPRISRSRRGRASAVAVIAGSVLVFGAPAALAGTVPSGNLTSNPSFDRNTSGWDGFRSDVKRIKTRSAPDGRFAAKVGATRDSDGMYTIDDSPDTLKASSENPPQAGEAYSGTAYVKGTGSSVGEKAGVVVREWSHKKFVASKASTVTLTKSFQKVSVDYTVHGEGDTIDVYVERPEGTVTGEDDSFLVDAISLVKGPSSTPADISDTPPPPPSPPPSGQTPLTTSMISLNGPNDDALLAESGTKYRYIIVRDSLHNHLDELRAEHPGAKILVYKDVSFTIPDSDGCPYAPYEGGGVSFCVANSHEDWFLHDKTTGARGPGGNDDSMNIGNAGYENEWAKEVLARLRDADNNGSGKRYDGVFMDDTNLYPGYGMDGHIAEMSDAGYRQATQDFVHNVSSQIRGAGFITMANVALDPTSSTDRTAALSVARDLSVFNREGFVRWSQGPLFTDPIATSGSWMAELTLEEQVQAQGTPYQAITYGSASDVETQRYARATFLLGWNGQDGSALAYRPDGAEPQNGDWTADVGYPTSSRFKVGGGWQRAFSDGVVVVNPQASGSQSFALGASYQVPGQGCRNSVTLAPTRALMLNPC